jgi:MtrB/PioB family decaheme-associated outer membrane protein
MKLPSKLAALLALLLLTLPSVGLAQTQDKDKTQTQAQDQDADHGYVDFGVRFATGDVYGRPDLPFDPSVKDSKFNEYRDVRDGFYLRRVDVRFDNVLNSKNYVWLQSQRTLYRDQSYLASFGSFGKFRIQFRYDQIPHIYSNTTRILATESSPGIWTFPALVRQALQAAVPAGNSLQNIINTQLVPQLNFITPSIVRRDGTATAYYNITSRLAVNALFFRESQRGLRPIGLVMNSSPSATATSGFGLELPEAISYYNNRVVVGLDYGWKGWGLAAAYIGSFFQNNIKQLFWDNPFRLTGETPTTPLTGRMALYPDNHANSLNFAGAGDLTRYLHFTVSITPGWLRQNASFFPYSTNTAINTCGAALNQACTDLAALPESSLHGNVQTLAMNYTLVSNPWKSLELKANYRHYDYNDNTPVLNWTPVQGDVGVPTGLDENTPFGFNRKNLELTGNWYFGKRSSLKLGYEAEWMDRAHRDAAHSLENSFFTAVDWVPVKDLLFRVSYRHSDRNPDNYQNDNVVDAAGNEVTCTDTTTFFTADQRCHRRFDEAARLRNRGDALVQYSPTDKTTISGFFGTMQDNYNRRGGTNSPTPLNFISGTTNPYYLYGLLKDLSYNWGFDADYAISPQVTIFAEYSHERYHKRMITRYRVPEASSGTGGCGPSTGGVANQGACDTANNDWQSVAQEPVDIYAAGADWAIGRKMTFTTYYSLSAGRANVNSEFLGDPVGHPFLIPPPAPPAAPNTPPNDPNRFQLVGTNAAVDYPETVNRTHEVAFVFKYKLTNNLIPRFEYRYQQWDNRDYQTSAITPYMGCVSAAPPATVIAGCTNRILDSSTSPTPNPGALSPFYPGFVVGDPSAARYLFLGVDQPSYHAHTIIATLEYRF